MLTFSTTFGWRKLEPVPIFPESPLLPQAEAFNSPNHSNFGTPNRFVNTPQFGAITEASTPGREFQLSARLSF